MFHQTSELVASLKINHEEHFLRALADTGARSSITLENYILGNIIRINTFNKITWSTFGGQLITDKTGLLTFPLPEFNLKKPTTCVFHVYDQPKASSTYYMIIARNFHVESGMILNFNDHTVTWDTDTIPMKDRGTLNTQEALVEAYLASTETQSLVDEFFYSLRS